MVEFFDKHIIKVESVYDGRPTDTGILRLNTAWYRTEKELDRYERKLLQGTIVGVPLGYSEKGYMPIDPGIPNPKIFIGHDAIQKIINSGDTTWSNAKYHPGLTEKIDFETIADYGFKIDAKIGEKVYFHPSVTESENVYGENEYLASVDQIICVIREGTIVPQGGFVLVEPVIDETLESSTGLITGLESEPVPLEGIVRHVRDGIDIQKGDRILYQDAADWEVTIEGIKYYAMKEDEIWIKQLTD